MFQVLLQHHRCNAFQFSQTSCSHVWPNYLTVYFLFCSLRQITENYFKYAHMRKYEETDVIFAQFL